MKDLTELEGVALGTVSKHQPCTAYAVRRELNESPSTFWKASAGSVYPLLDRLEEAGLVQRRADSRDGRNRRLLRVSKKGERAFSSWIAKAADSDIVAAVYDPVRSRTFFWHALPARERRALARKTLAALETYRERTREHLNRVKNVSDEFEYIGALGAEMQAQSRVEWMRRFVKKMD